MKEENQITQDLLEAEAKKVGEFITNLRLLADFYEQHPSLPRPDFPSQAWLSGGKEELARVAKELGTFEKEVDDNFFQLVKQIGTLKLKFGDWRYQVCEKVVVGTEKKIVKKQIREPLYEDVEEEVEKTEWKCPGSLLAPQEKP